MKNRSITSGSSRKWISEHELDFKNYLRDNHKEDDYEDVINLVYHQLPDEGMKLIINYNMTEKEKLDLLIKWIVHSSQITALIFGINQWVKIVYCVIFTKKLLIIVLIVVFSSSFCNSWEYCNSSLCVKW